jgi:hypothetical protein
MALFLLLLLLLHRPCLFCKDLFGERGHNTCGVLFGGWMNRILLASSVEV